MSMRSTKPEDDAWEWITFAGFATFTVGPPSRRRTILAIRELVFLSERDARDAAKLGGGTWAKRRRHKTRKAERAEGRASLARLKKTAPNGPGGVTDGRRRKPNAT